MKIIIVLIMYAIGCLMLISGAYRIGKSDGFDDGCRFTLRRFHYVPYYEECVHGKIINQPCERCGRKELI